MEGTTDEEPFAAESERTDAGDRSYLKVAWVLWEREAVGIAAGRGLPEIRRGLVLKCLVRTLEVVLSSKGVEPPLLRLAAAGRWPYRLCLEGLVHPFVGAVLFGVPWIDALVADSQACPPDREATEALCCIGQGERDAIVGADHVRQAVLQEASLEPALGVLVAG
jgi:hypothetical protein